MIDVCRLTLSTIVVRWLVIAISLSTVRSAFSPEITEMVHTWAPLVWLHSGEQFMPSSVEFFLEHVNLQDRKGRLVDGQPSAATLPAGPNSATYRLQSKQKLGCPSCLGPAFFHGASVANGAVPVYAIVRPYNDAWKTTDVVYHTFYPYNRGKDVCLGITRSKGKDNCLGNVESFGNHVGDWEHVTLRFRNGKPHIIYVSTHTFGAYYVWNDTHGHFLLHRGETPKEKAQRCGRKRRIGRDLPVSYPPALALSGKHPVLYSANGSHGLWAAPGRHTYSTFPLLEDFTDQGVAWNTWENLVVIPWNDAPFPYTGNLAWLNFRGDWGNAKSGCDFEAVSGECKMNHGPTFPGGPDDIPPPRIQRSRQSVPGPPPPLVAPRVATAGPYLAAIPGAMIQRYSPRPRLYRFKRAAANATTTTTTAEPTGRLVNPSGSSGANATTTTTTTTSLNSNAN